jgi:DNA-binding NarL/FixJ family response regulator
MPNMTVILIDDSVVVRDRLIRLLGEVSGLEIVGMAEDETGALLLYEQCQPDAAVLDISLRTGSGLVVLEHIKRHKRQCLVIVLTNCIHAEFRRRCEQAGADYFFEKFREFDQAARVLQKMSRQRLSRNE